MAYSKDLSLGIDYALKTKYWIAVFLTAGFACNEKQIEIMIKVFWISLFIGSILSFLQYMGLLGIPKTRFLGFGLVYTVSSMYILIGLLTVSYYFRVVTDWKKKCILMILLMAFLFYLTILRGRNGYFVLILVSPLIMHNLTFKIHFSFKLLFLFVLIGSLSLSPVVKLRVKTTINQLKRIETIKEGQIDPLFIRPFMYHSALKLIFQNPILGVGTGSLKYYTERKGHAVDHPHNNILYMGVSFGIVGIISCLWLFWTMLKISWVNRGSPAGYFVFSICIVIFLGGVFDTLIINSGTSLLLPMGYGLLNHLDA
ncbi:MAG: O-antigen ligase family protein [Desulfobacula sp.]|nr:O-antigen ligase family protein [Desulfobacula sp.]